MLRFLISRNRSISTVADAAPQPPQSTVPIATVIIIIVMIAVLVAALGFVAIRKGEKP